MSSRFLLLCVSLSLCLLAYHLSVADGMSMERVRKLSSAHAHLHNQQQTLDQQSQTHTEEHMRLGLHARRSALRDDALTQLWRAYNRRFSTFRSSSGQTPDKFAFFSDSKLPKEVADALKVKPEGLKYQKEWVQILAKAEAAAKTQESALAKAAQQRLESVQQQIKLGKNSKLSETLIEMDKASPGVYAALQVLLTDSVSWFSVAIRGGSVALSAFAAEPASVSLGWTEDVVPGDKTVTKDNVATKVRVTVRAQSKAHAQAIVKLLQDQQQNTKFLKQVAIVFLHESKMDVQPYVFTGTPGVRVDHQRAGSTLGACLKSSQSGLANKFITTQHGYAPLNGVISFAEPLAASGISQFSEEGAMAEIRYPIGTVGSADHDTSDWDIVDLHETQQCSCQGFQSPQEDNYSWFPAYIMEKMRRGENARLWHLGATSGMRQPLHPLSGNTLQLQRVKVGADKRWIWVWTYATSTVTAEGDSGGFLALHEGNVVAGILYGGNLAVPYGSGTQTIPEDIWIPHTDIRIPANYNIC